MTILRALACFPLVLLAVGCVDLELSTNALDMITTEEVVLVAEQPGNVTSSSDLVSTKWTSSDESVVTVTQSEEDPRQATVVAVGAGTATVEVVEGGTPDTCEVTVLAGATLTIAVDANAFQLIEPRLDDIHLGEEGYSDLVDAYAMFLDVGASETVLVEAGERQLTFMTGTSWLTTSQRYQLTDPIVVEDGVQQTYTFHGEVGEYEEVP